MRVSIQCSIQVIMDGATEETLSLLRPYAWHDEYGTLMLTSDRIREAFEEDHHLWEQAEFGLNNQIKQIYEFYHHDVQNIDGDLILER